MKKILLASLFIGGGYFLIKKLLPTYTKSNSELKLEKQKNSSDVVNDIIKKQQEKRKKIEDELKTHYNEDGTKNRKWFESRNNFKL